MIQLCKAFLANTGHKNKFREASDYAQHEKVSRSLNLISASDKIIDVNDRALLQLLRRLVDSKGIAAIKKFGLLSRICGEIPVRGAAPSCDKGQFPWLRR